MMRERMIILVVMLLIGVLALGVGAGAMQDGFVIERADAVATQVVAGPPELATVEPRFVVEFANEMLKREAEPVPDELAILLGQVGDRFVLEFANASHAVRVEYPVELIGDSTAPTIEGVSATPLGSSGARITWTTDEYADSLVEYGLLPGSYPESVYDPLYVKDHSITLSGLAPEATYYARVSSTDRSGNVATSPEFEYGPPPMTNVYLPLVLREH
jgi:hypothetical protein